MAANRTEPQGPGGTTRVYGSGGLAGTWRRLPRERRLAAGAAFGLFLSLFLPWYQSTVVVATRLGGLRSLSTSATGWGAFSFVEAAVLLVAAFVLALLYIRAQGRPFHLPGGDGSVIMAAGVWTCLLVLWRIFDKEAATAGHGRYLTSEGVEWGIFVALAIAGLLAYAGAKVRRLGEPEPPLPGESAAPGTPASPGPSAPRKPPAPPEPRGDPVVRRRRPVAATPAVDPALTPRQHPPADPGEAPTLPRRPRAPSPLFGDLDTLEIQDPPTATLKHTPAPPRDPEG